MKNNKKNKLFWAVIGASLTMVAHTEVYGQMRKKETITDEKVLKELVSKVEHNFDSLSFHKELIEGMGTNNPKLVSYYDKWIKANPNNANIPFALGEAYENEESPKAKTYLLKAVDINPKFTEAWGGLWIDAERWGDNKLALDYLKKAVDSDPSNPNYAFYYASSFSNIDTEKYKVLSQEVAQKFNTSERGAQALYWLAVRSTGDAYKESIFKQLKTQFNPQKFGWSSSGMNTYFDLLVGQKRYAEAKDLATEMVSKTGQDGWKEKEQNAVQLIQYNKELDKGNQAQALTLLDQIKVSKYAPLYRMLPIYRADILVSLGKGAEAYAQLLAFYAKSPSNELRAKIAQVAGKIGKDSYDKDIMQVLVANATPAAGFELKNYEGGTTSLEDLKGKVVLLTYWFPGCGPCRGEFPHFQKVVDKFAKDQLSYVGINIVPEQNDYVLPFLKSTKYSFYPLEEKEGRVKGNLDNRGAAPVNFLLDKQGRIIFSNFRTDQDNEDELELMINESLKI